MQHFTAQARSTHRRRGPCRMASAVCIVPLARLLYICHCEARRAERAAYSSRPLLQQTAHYLSHTQQDRYMIDLSVVDLSASST